MAYRDDDMEAWGEEPDSEDDGSEVWTEEEVQPEDTQEKRVKPGQSGRRKRRRRRRRRRLLILSLLLIAAVLIGLFVFRVQNLQIEGNRRVSDEEVRTLIHWESSRGNTLLLWLLNRRVDVSDNELLNGISVDIIDPRTVRVRVEEQTLVGCIQIGSQYYYVNRHGMIIISQTDKLTEVPLIEGVDVAQAEAGAYVQTDNQSVLDDMLDIADALDRYEIHADKVSEAENGGFMVEMDKIRVMLGYDIYMEEKISELKALLPELQGMSGVLHLEEYDSTKDSIIFTKDS